MRYLRMFYLNYRLSPQHNVYFRNTYHTYRSIDGHNLSLRSLRSLRYTNRMTGLTISGLGGGGGASYLGWFLGFNCFSLAGVFFVL